MKVRFRMLAATCCVLGTTALAAAQSSYRVIDVGTLYPSRRDFTVTYDINSFGQAVGESGTGVNAPVLWNLGVLSELPRIDSREDAAAAAMNDHGTIVGWSNFNSSTPLAAVWVNQQVYSIGTLGGARSQALGVNRNDVVVGWAETSDRLEHGFVLRDQQMIDIGTLPGGFESGAADVDSFGRVCGWATDANGWHHAIIWENGLMASLGMLPGARDSFAEAMNDHDQVVGSSDNEAFLFEGDFTGGTMSPLPSLGGKRSYALDINNNGVIVGNADPPGNGLRPCIWIDRQPYDLNDFITPSSGWEITSARAINDSGYIAGAAKRDETERAVVLVPTPLHLSPPTPGIAGQMNTIVATGATPGAQVRLLYGTQLGYSHPAGCPTAIVEMRQSSTAGSTVADQDGVVTLQLMVPPAARGRIFIIQMIEPTGCALSQPLITTFR
ncbi:MAG: hypothetical protein IT430_04045 [Phycisphaerales bacterium]|nr:hypothetical protein [Phycisphaerales bacterium]